MKGAAPIKVKVAIRGKTGLKEDIRTGRQAETGFCAG